MFKPFHLHLGDSLYHRRPIARCDAIGAGIEHRRVDREFLRRGEEWGDRARGKACQDRCAMARSAIGTWFSRYPSG